MNEKIRELALQATIRKFDGTGTDMGKLVLDEQKFAELIVRECADFLKEWESYQEDMANQCNGHFPTGGDIKLKEHFGVEE